MMKKTILLLVTSLVFMACIQKIEHKDLHKINGYWEIEKVTMKDGTEKKYKISETIDYFEVKKDSGFRKKVKPQFDGKYLVDDQQENLKISFEGEKAFVSYSTSYLKWKEEIVVLSDEQLVLKNEAGIEYQYKKPTAFTLK